MLGPLIIDTIFTFCNIYAGGRNEHIVEINHIGD